MKVKVKKGNLVLIDNGIINDDSIVKIPLELVPHCTWNKEFFNEYVIPALSNKGHYDILQLVNGAEPIKVKKPGELKKTIIEEHVETEQKAQTFFPNE